jgi:membrane protein YqaA with SNARE-associated domain
LAAAAFLAGSLVPLPSEAILIALIALGRGAPAMVAVAAAANSLGGALLFFLGRSGRAWTDAHVKREHLERARRHFLRFGPALLLLSWVPVLGDAIVLAAGAFRVRWRVALPLLAAGKGARYAVVAVVALRFRA